jgi:hypothetical protein
MKMYSNITDAISDLHNNGFTDDFHLSGNDLFWVQEKLLIRAGEFAILEWYNITKTKSNMDDLVVFGIIAPYHNLKGVLIGHEKSNTNSKPPVIVKKLNELKAYLTQ